MLLAWLYYAAQIFLVGAEFTKVFAHAHGSAKDQDRATPVQLMAAGAHKTVPAPAPQQHR